MLLACGLSRYPRDPRGLDENDDSRRLHRGRQRTPDRGADTDAVQSEDLLQMAKEATRGAVGRATVGNARKKIGSNV